MNIIKSHQVCWKSLALILLGAGAYAMAFPPVEFTPAAWLAPVFWLLLLRSDHKAAEGSSAIPAGSSIAEKLRYLAHCPARRRFWLMFAVGYLGSAIVVYWLTALFSTLALALWLVPGLWFGVWGIAAGYFTNGPRWLRIAWPAVAWVAMEYLRCELAPLAFSFGSLGSSQTSTFGFSLASIVGVYGISGLMVLTSAASLELWQNRRQKILLPAAASAVAIAGAGIWLSGQETHNGKVIGTALLQQLGQEDDIGAWSQVPSRNSLDQYDLVVWPELTYANDPRMPECRWFVDMMHTDAARANWGCIFGAVEFLKGSKTVNDPFHNTAYFMKPDGTIAASAGKNQPVQLLNDGLPAADVAVMNLSTAANHPPVKAGVGVCYDGCFQRFAQRMVSRGAQSWYFRP